MAAEMAIGLTGGLWCALPVLVFSLPFFDKTVPFLVVLPSPLITSPRCGAWMTPIHCPSCLSGEEQRGAERSRGARKQVEDGCHRTIIIGPFTAFHCLSLIFHCLSTAFPLPVLVAGAGTCGSGPSGEWCGGWVVDVCSFWRCDWPSITWTRGPPPPHVLPFFADQLTPFTAAQRPHTPTPPIASRPHDRHTCTRPPQLPVTAACYADLPHTGQRPSNGLPNRNRLNGRRFRNEAKPCCCGPCNCTLASGKIVPLPCVSIASVA